MFTTCKLIPKNCRYLSPIWDHCYRRYLQLLHAEITLRGHFTWDVYNRRVRYTHKELFVCPDGNNATSERERAALSRVAYLY